jgi:hypothetical protein
VTFTEPPLFDIDTPTGLATKTPAQLARELRPRWTRQAMSGPHRACDECLRELHAAGGTGPLPRRAAMVRTVKATGDVQRLCTDHGAALKAADQPRRRKAVAR